MYLYSLPNNVLNKQLDEVTQSMTEVVTRSNSALEKSLDRLPE